MSRQRPFKVVPLQQLANINFAHTGSHPQRWLPFVDSSHEVQQQPQIYHQNHHHHHHQQHHQQQRPNLHIDPYGYTLPPQQHPYYHSSYQQPIDHGNDHHHHLPKTRNLPPHQPTHSNSRFENKKDTVPHHHKPAQTAPNSRFPQGHMKIGARFYRATPQPTAEKKIEHKTHQVNTNRLNFSAIPATLSRNIHSFRHTVVEYENLNGLRKLGVIVSPHQTVEEESTSSKWKLIDGTGEPIIIDNSQLTYQWPSHGLDKTTIGEKDVQELEQQCLSMVTNSQPKAEQVWKEFLTGRTSLQVSCQDVAIYLFDSQSPSALYASHRFLYDNPLYFSCKNQNGTFVFECRSVREVEDLKKVTDEESQKIIAEKLFLTKIANTLLLLEPSHKTYASIKFDSIQTIRIWQPEFTGTSADLSNEQESSIYLRELKTFALNQQPHDNTKTYDKFVKPFNVPNNESDIFEFCLQMNLFDTPNIHLLRSSLIHSFPENIRQQARETLNDPGMDRDHKVRRNLKHLQVFTIDSYPETIEIDDGISLEVTDEGKEYLYVHIADATRFITYGSDVDKHAAQVSTSVYLPEKFIPMLPKELSVDLMSLSDARENYVLTFKARVLPDGELDECDVFPAIVDKVKKIDYEETDQILLNITSAEHTTYETLQRLLRIANIRLQHRMQNGASVSFSTPQTKIKVKKNNQIHVARSEAISYSRRMIQEFMIIANQISAKFASDNGIIVPYRGTGGGVGGGVGIILDKPSEEEINKTINADMNMTESELINLILENHSNFQRMPAACITQTPSWHGGVGVSGYVQATSPIRRYSDLLVHYQLKACIRGDSPPLTWDELQHLLMTMEPSVKMVSHLQKMSEKFWLLKYFKDNMKTNKYKALVLETNPDPANLKGVMAMIYLLDVGFKTQLHATRKLSRGDLVHVFVTACNPYKSLVEFDLN